MRHQEDSATSSLGASVTYNNMTANRDGNGGPPTVAYLKQQMELGHDVELLIDYLDDMGNVIGGRVVAVSGFDMNGLFAPKRLRAEQSLRRHVLACKGYLTFTGKPQENPACTAEIQSHVPQRRAEMGPSEADDDKDKKLNERRPGVRKSASAEHGRDGVFLASLAFVVGAKLRFPWRRLKRSTRGRRSV